LLFTETETLAGYVTEYWYELLESLGLLAVDSMKNLETR